MRINMGTDSIRRILWSRVIALCCTLILFGIVARPIRAQTSDVTPPALRSFSFAPSAIDVSGGAQAVSASAHATDELSGVAYIQVFFRSPTGVQSLSGNMSRASGDNFDGSWAGSIQFPQFAAGGVWTVSSVIVFDNAGNSSSYTTSVLNAGGFPTQLFVTSSPDVQAPNVVGLAISPAVVDVSASDKSLIVGIQVTDDISGVSFTPCVINQPFGNFAMVLRSPSGLQLRYMFDATFSLTSGTRTNGTWTSNVTMPRFSEPGSWRILSVLVHDCAGNQRSIGDAQLTAAGLQVNFNVISSPSDVVAPSLTSLSFTPITINTATGYQFLTVRIGVSDDLAGGDFSQTTPQASFFERGLRFRSPSGNQTRDAAFYTSYTRVSGTPQNGVWEATIFFPQFSEEGTWQIDFLSIKDAVRNVRSYSTAQLLAAGFQTTLDVIKPSLVTDGLLGSGGGTISDQVFGGRASVTFPAGAVSVSTQVAIDVFANPLQVPIPVGFSGAATNFVNIQLTPEPNFPLAAPGLTVVLPMPNAMVSGTALSLYKIDVVTGNLIPAINVSGHPVVGHVNVDGLSATFTGISSLSTVVGLLADPIQVALDVRAGNSATIPVGASLAVNTSAIESDNPIAGPWRYVLDWGDGTNFTATIASLPTAVRPTARGKVYTKTGTYTVRLTITDANGLHGSQILLVTVNP